MPWGVQQGEGCSPIGELRLLGEDGNASLPLLSICIQKGVLMIYPPQLPQGTAQIQQPLGECGLAAIHMGQNPHYDPSHFMAVPPSALLIFIQHTMSPVHCQGSSLPIFSTFRLLSLDFYIEMRYTMSFLP